MNKSVPNYLTTIRIVLTVVFIIVFNLRFYTASSVIFLIAALTDFFDGLLARKYNFVSNYGKFTDPLADKILVFSALILFVEYGFTPSYVVIFMIFREFVITGLRLIYSSKGKVIPAQFSGKVKTTVQFLVILLILYAIIRSNANVYQLSLEYRTLTEIIKYSNWLLILVTLYSFDYVFRFDLKKMK